MDAKCSGLISKANDVVNTVLKEGKLSGFRSLTIQFSGWSKTLKTLQFEKSAQIRQYRVPPPFVSARAETLRRTENGRHLTRAAGI